MNTILKSADDSKDNSSSNNNSNNNKASDAIGIKVVFLKALRPRIWAYLYPRNQILASQSKFYQAQLVSNYLFMVIWPVRYCKFACSHQPLKKLRYEEIFGHKAAYVKQTTAT